MEPTERTEPRESQRSDTPGAGSGSRFERWDESMPVPAPAPSPMVRSSVVSTAAAILVVIGVFLAAIAIVFVPGGGIELGSVDVADSTALAGFLAAAALYVVAGVLVFRRLPAGRTLGVVIGVLGLVFGILQLPSSGVAGLPTLGVNAFVIWALASGGSAFRRR